MTDPPTHRLGSPVYAVAASFLFVAAVVALLIHLGIDEQVLDLLQWIRAQGAWAAILFILMMAVAVVLLLPGVLLTTGAGFVFGVLQGSIYVVAGTTLGACIAFLIARHLFGRRARDFILAHSRLRAIDEEMAQQGWKVVLLTRLIPFFPSKISNYFFGLAGFPFPGYVLGSAVGFIPFSVHNVYLGAIAADLATLGEREFGRTPAEWAVYGAGFAATVVAVLYINRLARRALDRYTRDQTASQTGNRRRDRAWHAPD